jgi:hypothetical protein
MAEVLRQFCCERYCTASDASVPYCTLARPAPRCRWMVVRTTNDCACPSRCSAAATGISRLLLDASWSGLPCTP